MLPMEDTRPNVNIYILCLQYNTDLLKKFYTTSNTKIHKHARTYACTHTHTHTFNGPLSRITWVSRY